MTLRQKTVRYLIFNSQKGDLPMFSMQCSENHYKNVRQIPFLSFKIRTPHLVFLCTIFILTSSIVSLNRLRLAPQVFGSLALDINSKCLNNSLTICSLTLEHRIEYPRLIRLRLVNQHLNRYAFCIRSPTSLLFVRSLFWRQNYISFVRITTDQPLMSSECLVLTSILVQSNCRIAL